MALREVLNVPWGALEQHWKCLQLKCTFGPPGRSLLLVRFGGVSLCTELWWCLTAHTASAKSAPPWYLT